MTIETELPAVKVKALESPETAADAYVAENGIEHSGGIIEVAFEAGARWAVQDAQTPYGYVFGGCTFLRSSSPLVTDYVKIHSLPVFLQPAKGTTISAEAVLAIRDALLGDSVEEAYHQLYRVVDPDFVKLKPWEEIEAEARAAVTEGVGE
jgi:hypothetical protein